MIWMEHRIPKPTRTSIYCVWWLYTVVLVGEGFHGFYHIPGKDIWCSLLFCSKKGKTLRLKLAFLQTTEQEQEVESAAYKKNTIREEKTSEWLKLKMKIVNVVVVRMMVGKMGGWNEIPCFPFFFPLTIWKIECILSWDENITSPRCTCLFHRQQNEP